MADTRKFNGKIYHLKYIFEGDTLMKNIKATVEEYKEKGYYVRLIKDFWIPNNGWRRSMYIRRK